MSKARMTGRTQQARHRKAIKGRGSRVQREARYRLALAADRLAVEQASEPARNRLGRP